ncbi:hypothetical protein Tco_1021692 [Tanacetum coccineum]
MANLDFCDKHNMVAYLQKSEGSEGFHQIIDFITTSHIRKVKVVSEASIRIHLKLEDSDGISTLPTSEIFEQVSLMGSKLWGMAAASSATWVVCIEGGEVGGCEVDGALMGV